VAVREVMEFSSDRVFLSILAVWGLVVSVPVILAVSRFLSRVSRRGPERVLVIGRSPLAEQIVAEIEARPFLRQKVVGVVDESSRPLIGRCLGSDPDLRRIVEESRPRRVIGVHRTHRPLERGIDDAMQAGKARKERSQLFPGGGRYFGQHASPC